VTPSPLDLIADAVRRQECILFLGAGVHAPPTSDSVCEERPYPTLGTDLSVELAGLCDLAEQYPQEDPRNLARVATFFENRLSRHQLVQAIAERIQQGRCASPMLRALAELDFPLVITTNQDTWYESWLWRMGKQPRLSIYTPESRPSDDPALMTAQSPVIYKLHGDIDHPETIVVTDEDLMTFIMRMNESEAFNPVPTGLKFHLKRWTTLFVGYSLRDYNLRLLLKTLHWRIDKAKLPEMFSVDLHPDPLILEVWENKHRHVRFLAEDVWRFVPELYERVLGRELSL
jgi:hypothetical protein